MRYSTRRLHSRSASALPPAGATPSQRRLLHMGTARLTGAALLTALALFAFVTPVFHEADPARQNLLATLTPPGSEALLGTDHLGRSMLSRMSAAMRLSLGLSLASVATALIPGVLLGVIAGWRGGRTDRWLGVLADTFLALPGLLLVLLLVAIAPGSFLALYVGISLVLWIEYFRFARAVTAVTLHSPQIEASRLLGFGRRYCFYRHLWPALLPGVATLAAFGAASAILAVAALGFVSVGVSPPTAELGMMVTELFPWIFDAPWLIAQPVLAITLMVLGFHLLAGEPRA